MIEKQTVHAPVELIVELVPVLLVCVLVAGILLASALASKDQESGR